MAKHTPWRVKMDYVVKGDHEAVDLYSHKKRIVACVNALAGVKDPGAFMRECLEMSDPTKGYTRSGILRMLARHLNGGE